MPNTYTDICTYLQLQGTRYTLISSRHTPGLNTILHYITIRVETGSGHSGQTGHICAGQSEFSIGYLIRVFQYLARAMKMQNCYLFSYRLAS